MLLLFSVLEGVKKQFLLFPPILYHYNLIGRRILHVIVLVTSCRIRAGFNQVSKNKNPSNYSSQSQSTQTTQWANLPGKSARKVYEWVATGFGLIWESGTRFLSQSLSTAMRDQTKRELTSALSHLIEKSSCSRIRSSNRRNQAQITTYRHATCCLDRVYICVRFSNFITMYLFCYLFSLLYTCLIKDQLTAQSNSLIKFIVT